MGRLIFTLLLASPLAQAEITLDGSLGPAGVLEGLEMEIPAEVGRQLGSNLFHSFGRFEVPTGGSALFTGPAGIDHVIGRVTGGEVSTIDGLLGTAFQGSTPDLWLVNPAGVVFGPNATLDVQGGFHVSTADYLRLGEEGRFAAALGQGSTLTSAPPAAFGFLGAGGGSLTVTGSTLNSAQSRDLSLVAGNITVSGAEVQALGGRLSLAAVGVGEVAVGPAAPVAATVAPGTIQVTDSLLAVAGDPAGSLVIRGGTLSLAGTQVVAGTVDRDGGDITLQADAISIRDGSLVIAGSLGAGRGGDVVVEADELEVRGGAQVAINVTGQGDGGSLRLRVDRLLLSGDSRAGTAIITTDVAPGASGRGGDIIVVARAVVLRQGGQLYTSTQGAGDAGELRVSAREIRLSGENHLGITTIGSQTIGRDDGAGRGGDVTVQADYLEVRSAQFVALSAGAGAGGSLRITAGEIQVLGDAPAGRWGWHHRAVGFSGRGYPGRESAGDGAGAGDPCRGAHQRHLHQPGRCRGSVDPGERSAGAGRRRHHRHGGAGRRRRGDHRRPGQREPHGQPHRHQRAGRGS